MGKLTGKVAIVTGASRGIGQAIAELFAAEGAKVVCSARTLNEGEHRVLEGSLARTVERIKAAGGEATAVKSDISHEEDCIDLVEQARKTYGPIDILVNNAGLTYYLPTDTFPTNRWMRCFAVNVHAPFILSKEVLKDMIPRRLGAIVSVSSAGAIGPGRGPYEDKDVRGRVMYGATKAALERFTQGLAQEMAQYEGISVAAVSPSEIVPTPGSLYQTRVRPPVSEDPSVMARAVVLLASEPAIKVNGRVTYSQQILKEFGLLENASGWGVDKTGSGYSQI
jgi:NAD(P)-dependent dehydrogenase (short-subunit alcohol dehydrogenase family)